MKLDSDANYLEALKHDHIVPIMSFDLCSMVVHWPEAHFKYVDKAVEKAWVEGLKTSFTQMGAVGIVVQKKDHRPKKHALVATDYIPEPTV